MVAINPQTIEGNWLRGVALDFHTVSSVFLGYNQHGDAEFDTRRSEIGELLYRLKYRRDETAAPEIIAAAAGFLKRHREKLDLMIPVPPSAVRSVQPVLILARGIGHELGLPVVSCVTTTRTTTQLKSVSEPEERTRLLSGLYAVDAGHTTNKHVLLFDDLYRSGATMNAITDLLLGQGHAASVRALTITRTRVRQ